MFPRLSRDLRFVRKLAVSVAKPSVESEFKLGKSLRLHISSSETSSSPRLSDFQYSHYFELRDSVFESLPFLEFRGFGRLKRIRPKS